MLGAECFLELCVLVDVSQPATLKGACVRVCVCVCACMGRRERACVHVCVCTCMHE